MEEYSWPIFGLAQRLHPLVMHAADQTDDFPAVAVQAALAFARLYVAPEKAIIDPAAMLRDQRARLETPGVSLDLAPAPECAGDSLTIIAILRALRDALLPDPSTLASIRLTTEKDTPVVYIELDGPGCILPMITVEGYVAVPLTDIQEAWTLATIGGRIDRTPNGFVCKLRGVRKPRDPRPEAVRWADIFKHVLALSTNKPSGARTAILEILADLSGDDKPDACDLGTLLREKQSAYAPQISERDIRVDISLPDALPPLLLPRNMLAVALDAVFYRALGVLTDSGILSINIGYDKASRLAEMAISLAGRQIPERGEYLIAALKSIAPDTECIADNTETMISFTLPDKVGLLLDDWLPGYEIMGEQAEKMLRMLKAGSCPFPEEFVLGGVLETGMTRWLIPCLDKPVVAYFAQDISPDNKGLEGGNPDRLKKALEQVRRGKVRKEIAEAQYAAEIIHAFAPHEKGRKYLAADHLSAEELLTMAKKLLAGPDGLPEATRTLLKILNRK